MKAKKYKTGRELAVALNLPPMFGDIADLKAKLTSEIIKVVKKRGLTHQEVADITGIPRSAVTGIINNSLQRVTLDRLVRLLGGLGRVVVGFKLKDVA